VVGLGRVLLPVGILVDELPLLVGALRHLVLGVVDEAEFLESVVEPVAIDVGLLGEFVGGEVRRVAHPDAGVLGGVVDALVKAGAVGHG